MNSKQRRRDRRAWKHDIVFTHEQVYERGYNDMWDWCVTVFNNRGNKWREPYGPPGVRWQFTKPEYAVMFALRWQ
jgi:hypothetical protein